MATKNSRDALHDTLYDHDSDLVIGVVAQVGNDLDAFSFAVTRWLEDRQYEVHEIRVSKYLTVVSSKNEYERISNSQTAGNSLRRSTMCNHFLSLCAIAEIAQKRNAGDKKRAFIIRSLKRPEEIEVLRSVYGNAFVCVGVHTSRPERIEFLRQRCTVEMSKAQSEDEAKKVIDHDEVESDWYGQRTRDSYELCDIFVRGSFPNPTFDGLERSMKLVFGSVFTTPRIDEYGMYLAHSASYRSGDLARQVGAAICTSRGDVLAVACNEVPRHGGGQYWEDDPDDDRDLVHGKDKNDEIKNQILKRVLDIVESLQESSPAGTSTPTIISQDEKIEKLKESGILDITEYGRSVHAEMECLLSCARNGTSPKGAVLYTTTFPCHNCTRHIVSAGISRVVYVEPYPKSKALDLHQEEISVPLDDVKWSGLEAARESNSDKVVFEPFVGVGPRRYMDWFGLRTMTGKRIARKEAGKAIYEVSATLTHLKSPESQYSLKDRELIAVQQLDKIYSSEKKVLLGENVQSLLDGCSTIMELAKVLETSDEWRDSKAFTDFVDREPQTLREQTALQETAAEREAGTNDPKKRAKRGRPRTPRMVDVEPGPHFRPVRTDEAQVNEPSK